MPALPADAAPETEWQTVDFPGALRVDQIPQAAAERAQTTGDRDLAIAPDPRRSQLETENARLRTQIVQLEADLSQAQIDLQLEMARFYCKEGDDPTAGATPELDPAIQAQIQQLTDDLERSQETSQRQELLVETLTRQLESSQERIAQLERDCALSQQRYTEQVQLVSQVESNCRDLRMRLHRQQQQTLQFKIALEKSIEMATASGTETAAPPDDTQDLLPKAQPVQPWSNGGDGSGTKLYAVSRLAKGHLQNFFSHLLDVTPPAEHAPNGPEAVAKREEPRLPEVTIAPPTPQALAPVNPDPATLVPPATVAPTADGDRPMITAPSGVDSADLHQLFPSQPAPSLPVAAVPAEAAIFDLSPFVEAGEVALGDRPQAAEEPQPAPPSPQLQANLEGLWADLARLIEPELAAASEPAPAPAEPTPAPPTPQGPNAPAATISLAPRPKQREPKRDRPQPQPEPAIAAQNPFPSFNLREAVTLPHDQQRPEPVAVAQGPRVEQPAAADPIGWPAPVVYPFRPTKKIGSMAAVDLPTFPRS